jgi:HlyD family secretion protein
VVSVSRFPVSTEGAAKVIGNATVARTLTDGGYQIEVVAQLDLDPKNPSGYKWDLSSGPAVELTSGTIASALGTIESKAPITFILPILQ